MNSSWLLCDRYNVGHIDRQIQIHVGIVIKSLADMRWIDSWGWMGASLLLTGILRYCPFYTLLRINAYRNANYVG